MVADFLKLAEQGLQGRPTVETNAYTGVLAKGPPALSVIDIQTHKEYSLLHRRFLLFGWCSSGV